MKSNLKKCKQSKKGFLSLSSGTLGALVITKNGIGKVVPGPYKKNKSTSN